MQKNKPLSQRKGYHVFRKPFIFRIETIFQAHAEQKKRLNSELVAFSRIFTSGFCILSIIVCDKSHEKSSFEHCNCRIFAPVTRSAVVEQNEFSQCEFAAQLSLLWRDRLLGSNKMAWIQFMKK